METPTHLHNSTLIPIRFNEVDSLKIVWHGHYIQYFEEGREAFGKKYGLSYLNFFEWEVATPIVKVECDYKKMLKYGDTALVETTYFDSPAAKLVFKYIVKNAATNEIVATGKTVQVLLDTNYEMLLTIPAFLKEWKSKHLQHHE